MLTKFDTIIDEVAILDGILEIGGARAHKFLNKIRTLGSELTKE